jgi:serine O-acetyltransferase
MRYSLGQTVSKLFDLLADLITHNIRHDCLRYHLSCSGCESRGHSIALEVLDAIPGIRQTLASDVRAAFEGDPAAKSHDEVIFSYPGIYAISVYRVAHKLFELGVPMLPRIMTRTRPQHHRHRYPSRGHHRGMVCHRSRHRGGNR